MWLDVLGMCVWGRWGGDGARVCGWGGGGEDGCKKCSRSIQSILYTKNRIRINPDVYHHRSRKCTRKSIQLPTPIYYILNGY